MMFSTPDLSDKNDDARVIEVSFNHYGNVKSFCGQIETAVCPDDNSYVKEILEEDGKNRLLFVDGFMSMKCALLGDMLAAKAIDNNWSGIVINGCVRDVEVLSSLSIGIMAIASSPKRSEKKGQGSRSETLNFGNTSINRNDWAYCDQNGILISTKELKF
ncbi:MAG: ribonuclease E inhibitor RraA [Amoebophilaceae bacterium TMED152]|nr:hypothetical protein [Gammaproteobacteria bacterium]RPH02206.1 MAG: ribonuclease E inhibitor RraA [Amoebophilaceae bacterium TMED152]